MLMKGDVFFAHPVYIMYVGSAAELWSMV